MLELEVTRSALSDSYTAKRGHERQQEVSSLVDNTNNSASRQYMVSQMDKTYLDTLCKDASFRGSHNSYIPNF